MGAGPPPQRCRDSGKGLGVTGPPCSLRSAPAPRDPWGSGPALQQLPANDAMMELSLSNLCGDTCAGGGDTFLSPLQDLPSSFPLRRTSQSTSPRMRFSPARPRRTPGTSPTCGTGRRRTSTSRSEFAAGRAVSPPPPPAPRSCWGHQRGGHCPRVSPRSSSPLLSQRPEVEGADPDRRDVDHFPCQARGCWKIHLYPQQQPGPLAISLCLPDGAV